MSRLKSTIKSDKGVSNTIEMVLIVALLFVVMVTVIDAGIYFSNRHLVANAAHNGARTAAVFGGTKANSISKKYGITKVSGECASFGLKNPVECSVYNELKNSKTAVNAKIKKIECGPEKTTKVGDRTWCDIEYVYNGLPTSGMALGKFFGNARVHMSAESEVVHK